MVSGAANNIKTNDLNFKKRFQKNTHKEPLKYIERENSILLDDISYNLF